jgi:outer membrane immunogenic protein
MNELCAKRASINSSARGPFACCAVALIAGFIGFSPAARAQSSPDPSQLADTLKNLEARVSALEAENRQSKKEAAAARAEAQALRQQIGTRLPQQIGTRKPAGPTVAAAPTSTAMAAATSTEVYPVKSPMAPVTLGWGGFYAGAAGGVGWLHGNEALSGASSSSVTSTSPTFSSVDTSTSTVAGSFNGRNPGAMASLFLGYNYMPGSNWLIGGQLEGTLANTRVNLNGSGSSTSVGTTVSTPPGGAAGTTTSTGTGSFSGITDTLDNRWLLSVLARAGFLADPSDLVYVIGGYSYGRFEAGDAAFGVNTGFGMSGGTIGVGWEKQIFGNWNLRAEYRYTRFGSKTVDVAESNTSASTGTGGLVTTASSNINGAIQFSDVDMHSVWLGVSHSFGP